MKAYVIVMLVIQAVSLCMLATIIRESWKNRSRTRGVVVLFAGDIGLMGWGFWVLAS